MRDALEVIIAGGIAEARGRWSRELRAEFVVCEIADRAALEPVMAEFCPSVLVLDIGLPGLGRVDGLANVQRLSPATRIIVLTDHESEREGVSALMAGAKGYCMRGIDPTLLGKAVQAVRNGEIWVKRTLVHALVAALVSSGHTGTKYRDVAGGRSRFGHLTQRQREVADAIARGASNKQIARQLNVTERTVKAHLTEMFRTMGVLDRLHLALLLNDVPGIVFEMAASRAVDPALGVNVSASQQYDDVARIAGTQSD